MLQTLQDRFLNDETSERSKCSSTALDVQALGKFGGFMTSDRFPRVATSVYKLIDRRKRNPYKERDTMAELK